MLPTGRNIPPWKHGNTNTLKKRHFLLILFFSSPEHEGAVGTMRKKVEGRTKNILVFFSPNTFTVHKLYTSRH